MGPLPNVVVRPSGHVFPVERNESILQAGIKNGLPFDYGCGSGTCGLCKCRVVVGETRRVGAADYPLSAAEREQGYVLMCAHAPVGDIVIEAPEAGSPADIPTQQIDAKVRAVKPMGAATLMLHVQTPRTRRLRFLAGQSVTLEDARGGARHMYALASCPCEDRDLLFHVGRDESDAFASALFAGRVAPGDSVTVRGPYGDFVREREGVRPLIFICCDTGFAPVRSMIEHALASESADCYTLYWLATRADGHYLANQCAAWQDAFDRFEFCRLADSDRARGGRRIANMLANGAACDGGDVHVAGPSDFIDAVISTMHDHGLAPARLVTAA